MTCTEPACVITISDKLREKARRWLTVQLTGVKREWSCDRGKERRRRSRLNGKALTGARVCTQENERDHRLRLVLIPVPARLSAYSNDLRT